jgi:ribose transport system permease protein
VRVPFVTLATFMLAGLATTFASRMLTGYVNQAYQGMGDTYQMPVIAAVVIGGTSIPGGRSSYAGTFAGALFITLLASILSIPQISEGLREIAYGSIIVAMMLLHRQRRDD